MVILTVEAVLVQVVVGILAAVIAGALLAANKPSIARDDKPTTLATRGTFVPWILGLRRVGAVVGWAGDRRHDKESAGGKGSLLGGPEVDIYKESAMHQLCIGPADELRLIQSQGKVIFRGPITRFSHPSGSTVSLGKNGSFVIYWGEIAPHLPSEPLTGFQADQPVNTNLGAASRIGVESRWPGLCYIHWIDFRLGTSANWPLLDYTIAKWCHWSEQYLTTTEAYVDPTLTLDGPMVSIVDHLNGAQGIAYFEIVQSPTLRIRPTDVFALTGNALADQDLTILFTDTIQVATGDPDQPYEIHVRLYPEGGLSGADSNGQLQKYSKEEDDGLNPAHCIAELLFGPWPTGLARDPARYNVDGSGNSLDALAELCDTEGLRSSLIAQDGRTAKEILLGILQDLGVMIPLNTETGLIDFVPIRDRDPLATLPLISTRMQNGNEPEVEVPLGPKPVDKAVFSFSDRSNFFRDMTVQVKADGSAAFEENQRAQKFDMISVIDFDVASKVAERRSQEQLGGAAVVKVNANRGVRELIPGQLVEVEGFDEVCRVLGVEIDPDSADVTVELCSDFMGTAESALAHTPAFGPGSGDPVIGPPLQFAAVEVPKHELPAGDPSTLIVPHIRTSASITGTTCWISSDDVTYIAKGNTASAQFGGTLDNDLDADRANMVMDTGPTFTALGPDSANALDLTGDDTNWRLGRQLAVIVSDAGHELCHLQSVTALGGDSYRMDGLIRGRDGSVPLDHPAGAQVYIFPNDDVLAVQDPLFIPGAAIYVKMVPNNVPLSDVAPYLITIRGNAVVPMAPLNVRCSAKFAAVYSTGEDIEVSWSYRTPEPFIGAGEQGYGAATTPVTQEGTFVLEFLTTGDVLKRQVPLSVATYTYDNADLVADFGLEPTALHVRVRNVNGSFESENATLTITKV
jgi:hypothetical protein